LSEYSNYFSTWLLVAQSGSHRDAHASIYSMYIALCVNAISQLCMHRFEGGIHPSLGCRKYLICMGSTL